MAPLAAADGGYWPTAWGWAALAFAWVAVSALVLRETVRLEPLERLLLGAAAAFLGWVVLGIAWSDSPGSSFLEAERVTLFVTGLFGAVLVVRSRCYRQFLGGIYAGVWVVCAYALATRLFPDRLGVFDPIAGYRLSEPLGYWNALGIFAALGILVGLGFAIRGRTLLVRTLAGASLVTLLLALYFTFSRGAWLGLAVGLAAVVLADPRRLHFLAGAFALAIGPAAAVALAYGEAALTRPASSLPAATSAGHELAFAVLALTAANALVAVMLHRAQVRLRIAPRLRLAWGAGLVVAVLSLVVFTVVHYGGPVNLVERASASFRTPAPNQGPDLNSRLFSFSSNGRIDLWRAAWTETEQHPLAGSGAGTYEAYWLQDRAYPLKVRDAHSLYVETLAELGPIGLGLLLCMLLVPVVAGVAARRRTLVPAALGAYIAYVVHAAIDWDWEMTAVTLAALSCGVALLAAARRGEGGALAWRPRLVFVSATLVLCTFAFVGLVGNTKLTAASAALGAGHWTAAEVHARGAQAWMPWSPEPWRVVGHAQFVQGRLAAARNSFARAVGKDPRNWELWLELALATEGKAQRRAALRALTLNPLDPEVAALAERLHIDPKRARG